MTRKSRSCNRVFPLTLVLACYGIPLVNSAFADSGYEEKVISSVSSIQTADITSSLQALDAIVTEYPNSKLGHLVLADLLATRAGTRNLIDSYSVDQQQLSGLRDELRYRWDYNKLDHPAHNGLLPENLLLTSPDQEYTLVVDAHTARLFVYQNQNGIFVLVDDSFMTVGKSGMGKTHEGDLRTPIGVYFVTSYQPGEELPDRYGPGAFPINYPNVMDKRNNRTGYGIWIHGTESENYNRVPLASDGCVSLSNDDFLKIANYIDTDGSTPVIIAEKINWVDPGRIWADQSRFRSLVDQWIDDWESLDNNKYLEHYSKSSFESAGHDYDSWAIHKKGSNSGKQYIRVEIDDLSMFTYPGEENMVMMSFDQEYRSDNYSSDSRKSLIWQQDAEGEWKIIYEG